MSSANIDDIPIWLINLPRSQKRLAGMQSQLDAMGMAYRKFDAVDGKARWHELRETVDVPNFERNMGRNVLEGEIGCYHSHLGVWRELVASDAKVGLVLEDDVVFHDDFRDAVQAALDETDRWDILKLNKIRAKLPVRRSALGRWMLNTYLGPLTGTGAYLITSDTARKLLPRMLPVTRPIDHEIDRSHVHNIRHFGLAPFPSHVDDFNNSTITGAGFSAVAKFPRHQRLYCYLLRGQNVIGKARHTIWG